MLIHPQEALLQEAGPCNRALPTTNIEGAERWWNTDWPGWSIWASASLGISDAPRRNSSCIVAAVANLTLVAGKLGRSGWAGGDFSSCDTLCTEAIPAVLDFLPARFGQILTPALLAPTSLLKYISLNKAFRPDS